MGRVACSAETALSQENLNYIRFLCWKCQIKFINSEKKNYWNTHGRTGNNGKEIIADWNFI